MKALITGCGRGGTNLLCEYVRATNLFVFTAKVEDRTFFTRSQFHRKYATKLATENFGFSIENLERVLYEHEDFYIFFSLRHPIDCCMSKIYRGRPREEGGDCSDYCPDASIEGAVYAYKHMYNILNFLKTFTPNLYIFKMEDVITQTEQVCRKICSILETTYQKQMLTAYQNNRNLYHQKRYHSLNRNQINLYRNVDTSFEGWFSNKPKMVECLRQRLNKLIKELDYIE